MAISLNVELKNKEAGNEFFIMLIIGIYEALYNKKITINDARTLLFRPSVMKTVENVLPKIYKLAYVGTELEDVESLGPEKLEDNIIKLKKEALKLLWQTDNIYKDNFLYKIVEK